MKQTKIISAVLFAAALVLAILTGILSFSARGKNPVLISRPEEARQTAETMLEAVGRGDFTQVGGCLLGNPSFGEFQEPEDPLEKLLWEAFLGSFSWEILGDCYGSQSGTALDISASYLDFDSVMKPLGEVTKTLLNHRIGQAEDLDEIYDENNEYREELVQEVLQEAVSQTIREKGTLTQTELTLYLTHDGSYWKVIPDEALLGAISGGTLG